MRDDRVQADDEILDALGAKRREEVVVEHRTLRGAVARYASDACSIQRNLERLCRSERRAIVIGARRRTGDSASAELRSPCFLQQEQHRVAFASLANVSPDLTSSHQSTDTRLGDS